MKKYPFHRFGNQIIKRKKRRHILVESYNQIFSRSLPLKIQGSCFSHHRVWPSLIHHNTTTTVTTTKRSKTPLVLYHTHHPTPLTMFTASGHWSRKDQTNHFRSRNYPYRLDNEMYPLSSCNRRYRTPIVDVHRYSSESYSFPNILSYRHWRRVS